MTIAAKLLLPDNRFCQIPHDDDSDRLAEEGDEITFLLLLQPVTEIGESKRLLGEEEWGRPEHLQARSLRASCESGIFVLKHSFAFGSLRRCGLQRVKGELLEKALAYNLVRAAQLRRADEAARQRERLAA